ncbi:DNA polymerase subunit gamma-2, mitochondrial-like [Dendronephthya gigantea]|uniref:DNA polymerase subunit gamma-2, mitochondrial-like n=1 Tax=Dendronephthya gigantea TaxID=151771 RepID=UPI00106DD294|nr:DNA polymerase subunit gamma-2, mitochondrial-like [Dendronephthya gigantea]
MPKTRDVFTKVYQLCKARGFVFERSVSLPGEHVFSGLDYGPLGVEIKRNLYEEWWREIVTSRENVYGLDLAWPAVNNLKIQSEEVSKLNNSKYQHLGEYLTDTYHYACKLFKNQDTNQTQNSIGLAQSLTILQSDNATTNEFMFRAQVKEFFKLCFFCESNKVNYWMDYWMRKRLSWWKKYADIPAEITLVDKDYRNQFFQSSDENLLDTMSVQFNFPWGAEAVECISSYSEMKKLTKQIPSQDDINLGVVIATLSVERGILAYLLDAYHETEYLDLMGNTTNHSKLRLHPALAPVKVAVLSDNAINTDLGRVARQLTTELRQAGITSHYFEVERSSDMLDKYACQQDEIGTLYTVTVQDSTLTNGIVTLRNRDTTLSEFLHISEVLKTVQRHLDSQ